MKKVGITLRTIEARGYHDTRDALSRDWVTFLEGCGCVPILIPNNLGNPVDYFINSGCDVLLLSNGEDSCLRRDAQGHCVGTQRDMTEAKLVSYACDNKISVFGVCRGLQILNLYFGGKVISGMKGHIAEEHNVNIVDGLFRKYLQTNILKVNSYHRCGVLSKDLSEDLQPLAIIDNTVEGFYHKLLNVVGIQWHPERAGASKEKDKKFFMDYINNSINFCKK